MNAWLLLNLAGQYRICPEKRAAILRQVYRSDGKAGLEALVRALGASSPRPFLKWVEIDCGNRNRKRRGQVIFQDISPPPPPGAVEFKANEVFEESAAAYVGCKTGKQGGRKSVYSGQAWDAVRGGGK